jgi:hypothetical protein
MLMYQARFFPSSPAPWLIPAVFRLRLALLYFQGDGGGGAPPIFQGDGGGGAPPIFQGDGGGGAPPMDAVNVDPSLCAATTVFRPIAPTRINMAASRASLRDIMCPPGKGKPGRHSNLYRLEVKQLYRRICSKSTTGPAPSPDFRLAPVRNSCGLPHNRVLAVQGQRYCSTKAIGTLGYHVPQSHCDSHASHS